MRDSRLGLSDRYLMRQPLWFGRCIGHGAAAEARADAGRSGLLVRDGVGHGDTASTS